ncbi:MAG: 4a-hydroxytetrahydrobiopterin dehydratase [Verrucomicrobiia bacterium]
MAAAPSKLSDAEIAQRLSALKGWPRSERGWQCEGNAIMKESVLGGFTEATQFIARIAPIADAMDHHPDVQLHRYKRVKIILTTHSATGITHNDFDLAAKIDPLAPLGAELV